MKRVLGVILFAAALSTQVVAQDGTIFPKGEKAVTDHQVGTVWLNELSPADSTFTYNISMATFAPGARLHWHTHPAGQILLFTDGTDCYQERGNRTADAAPSNGSERGDYQMPAGRRALARINSHEWRYVFSHHTDAKRPNHLV
jgi:hypothetical protein